jgi:hypothetical protein
MGLFFPKVADESRRIRLGSFN